MKNIITFSGGKDSLATIIWAKNNLPDFEVVFCDTGWEHPATYNHIKQIEEWIGKEFVVLKHKEYPRGFIDLCIKKKRVPSQGARFCTEKLKVEPMIDYILSQKFDTQVIQGVRADESLSRSMMKQKDDYFRFYFEPKKNDKNGNPVFDKYRKKDIEAHCNEFSVDVFRPILKWNAQQVFEYIFEAGLKANPLYYEGFSRVGCFHCIMARHDEIKIIFEKYPETIAEIKNIEKEVGRSFFSPGYIPDWACSGTGVTKKSKRFVFPWIDDVVKYLQDNPNQIQMFPKHTGCISVYNICESGK